jgi:hypothetical protein
MITKLLLIFIAGFVIDLLITKYTGDVAEKRIWRATVLSGLITVANFLLLTVILKDSAMDGAFSIMAFAGNNGDLLRHEEGLGEALSRETMPMKNFLHRTGL